LGEALDPSLDGDPDDVSPDPEITISHMASVEPMVPNRPLFLTASREVNSTRVDGVQFGGRRKRLVEEGFLRNHRKMSFILLAEAFPVWLLALENTFTLQVHVMGCSSFSDWAKQLRDAGYSVTLVSACVNRLHRSLFKFLGSAAPPSDATLLVSGSSKFLGDSAVLFQDLPAIFLADSQFSPNIGLPSIPKVRWRQVKHLTVGGGSTFRALLGWSASLDIKLPVTSIRRSIGDALSYSEGLELLREPFDGAKHYSKEDRLRPSSLLKPVVYSSGLLGNRLGVRHLTVLEIAHIYGIPTLYSEVCTMADFAYLVPVQFMDALMDALLSVVSENSSPEFSSSTTPPPLLFHDLVVPTPTDSTWLPSIGRYLSHSWIDSETVTDKAVKADDAAAPSHMWDARIQLLWPSLTQDHLVALQSFLLRWLRRKTTRELRRYLADHYGTNWCSELSVQRKQLVHKFGSGSEEQTTGGYLLQLRARCDHYTTSMDSQPLVHEADKGLLAIGALSNASWWSWDAGSALFFWRWPETLLPLARDGMDLWISKPIVPRFKRSKIYKGEEHSLLAGKFRKMMDRSYVKVFSNSEEVQGCVDFFAVPKGEDDIRPVFNGTSCGLNECTWAPGFFLPTSATALRALNFNYCSVDVDLGEFFHNFYLSPGLRSYSGVDWRQFKAAVGFDQLPAHEFNTAFDRLWMGLRPSPFACVRNYYLAEEIVRGDRLDASNPLRWDRIILNLPGDPKFNPSLPRVFKWNDVIKNFAGDLQAFVDDLRASGFSEEHAWQVARRVAAILQYLGIQDAARKRRGPTRVSGAWAGAHFSTIDGKITKTVSQAKWDKAKAHIKELRRQVEDRSTFSSEGRPTVDFKVLMSYRGFLGHLAMTFEIITPFLKGFHQTLASHLPKRDDDGWRMTDKAYAQLLFSLLEKGEISEARYYELLHPPNYQDIKDPLRAKVVPRFLDDLQALELLFDADLPPEALVRSKNIVTLMYGFCDASGRGFGSTIQGRGGVRYRIGTWESDAEDQSSNWREFENAVESCESEAAADRLRGAMLFLLTDNDTVEKALYKGNSSSPKLFGLIVRLRKLEMEQGAAIHVIHVAGERMKAQGTDGVSRGQLREGVAAGANLLDFVPLNQSAIERSPKLKPWLNEVFSDWSRDQLEYLSPEDWFIRGHDIDGGEIRSQGTRLWIPHHSRGSFIWSPPPAAALVALEQLRIARIKRWDSFHVFVCPRLMTPEWRKHLHKTADVVFFIPPGVSFWPADMYEPLMIGIVFPFLPSFPWQRRGTPKMFAVERKLSRLFQEQELAARDFLCQFLSQQKRLPSMPSDVVRRVLYFERQGQVSSD
jgi:hypothetical protein